MYIPKEVATHKTCGTRKYVSERGIMIQNSCSWSIPFQIFNCCANVLRAGIDEAISVCEGSEVFSAVGVDAWEVPDGTRL